MPRDALANPIALAALGALLERPMHPYQLAAVLAERGVPVNRGSLYDTVDAMTRAGWVEPRPVEREGARPQRTPYALTKEGQAELARRLGSQVRAPRRESVSSISASRPSTSSSGGRSRRASRVSRMASRARSEAIMDA